MPAKAMGRISRISAHVLHASWGSRVRIDWTEFGRCLKDAREAGDGGLRETAKEAGVSHSTWCRAEQGKPISAPHYLALCAWIPIHPFRHFHA